MSKSISIKILVGVAIFSVCLNLYQCDENRDFKTELHDVSLRIKAKESERDSMKLELGVTRDSLKVAFNTILVAKDETRVALENNKLTQARYEKIIFKRYANDSARNAAISELYNTH